MRLRSATAAPFDRGTQPIDLAAELSKPPLAFLALAPFVHVPAQRFQLVQDVVVARASARPFGLAITLAVAPISLALSIVPVALVPTPIAQVSSQVVEVAPQPVDVAAKIALRRLPAARIRVAVATPLRTSALVIPPRWLIVVPRRIVRSH